MFSWKIIEKNSPDSELYERKLQEAFPNLTSQNKEGLQIGVYVSDSLVGGATLTLYQNLSEDPDIEKLWETKLVQSGIRISRLWAENCQHESPIPHIFSAILATVPSESYLYGILSLPLRFAKRRTESFFINNDWLNPRFPLEECHWDETLEASSEGKKLLKTYLQLGAQILGPVSGDISSHSVKVVMGMSKGQVLPAGRGILHA